MLGTLCASSGSTRGRNRSLLDEALRTMSGELTAVRRELARVLEVFQAVTRPAEEDEDDDA